MNGNTEYGPHIVQYPKEYSLCAGCHSCELMCGLAHNGIAGPPYGRIQVELDNLSSMIYTVYSCQHCADHPCYDACPKKDKAMCMDENGIVYVEESACIGCGKCVRACRFTPSRITLVKVKDKKQRKGRKSDLCRGREGGPVCLQHCSARCIGLRTDPLPYQTDENGEVKR